MRIVFMGTPDIAAVILQALIDAGEDVAAVVSQPDKPVGRKAELRPTPVKQTALAAGIPVLQPVRVRDEAFVEELRALAPDAIVVAAYGRIIPPQILRLPRFGCLNVHASLLPKYRGAAPIQWAVLDGEEETGVCIMQMDEGLDTGDILTVRHVPIEPEETGGTLFDKLAEAGARLLVETLPLVEAGTVRPQKQPEESPTAYARMITKQDGEIVWENGAAVIERQIRGLDPWPCAFTYSGKKMLKVWKARVADGDKTNAGGHDIISGEPGQQTERPEAGTVLAADADGIRVQTGDGVLCLTEVQLEGRKRMAAADFLRGHPLDAGSRLGRKVQAVSDLTDRDLRG